MLKMLWPFELELYFSTEEAAGQTAEELKELAEAQSITVDALFSYHYLRASLEQKEKRLTAHTTGQYAIESGYQVFFLLLEDFNAIGNTAYVLAPEEVLIYSTGSDYGYDSVEIENKMYRVKEELTGTVIKPKAQGNIITKEYYIILPDEAAWLECKGLWEEESINEQSCVCVKASGEKEALERYIRDAGALASGKGEEGFLTLDDGYEARLRLRSMYGGLLFIGIFFGIIFMLCMVLVMYYKQITEGFEDKNNFDIMRQVGMSTREVRATIEKQIFMVFFIPLAGAILHTAAGMPMIIKLMGAIGMYDIRILLWCGMAAVIAFCLIYISSYILTARAYLKIVRNMA